jgi:phage terminase large subunit-like protein
MLIDHMRQGLSFDSFYIASDVTDATIYNWLKKHPEFLEAKKEGEKLSRKQWEQWGIMGMLGKIKGWQNATWIFTMKNRYGYHDNISGRAAEAGAELEDSKNMLLEEVKALLDGEEEIKKIKDVTPIKLKAGESE